MSTTYNHRTSPRLRFLGAAETVTGSKYLLTHGEKNILIDCGLFQGLKELRLKNWDRFPLRPDTIDAIILTHAHIDHSGYIPRLIKEGFAGKIYCTRATMELCRILLPDAGYLQEEDAKFYNRKKLSKHSPALPLFSEAEAQKSLEQFVARDFDEIFEILPGVKVQFRYAGHILGAASAIVDLEGTRIAFSGDLGRINDPMLYPPALLPAVDYLVVESTYGDRKHADSNPQEDLGKIINETVKKNGIVIIPAFAVGRAQTLMHFLAELKKHHKIPAVPMYLNSPMATNVTGLFHEFESLHKLTPEQCDEMCAVVHYVKSVEESKELNNQKGPMIIISASGMATGGRVLHHLKSWAPDPNNTIVLAGFQSAGTRGRALQDGTQELKIHKEIIPVRARVEVLDNISVHGDYSEIIEWLSASKIQPKNVFVTHGESNSAAMMKDHLTEKFHWKCVVPKQDQEFVLA